MIYNRTMSEIYTISYIHYFLNWIMFFYNMHYLQLPTRDIIAAHQLKHIVTTCSAHTAHRPHVHDQNLANNSIDTCVDLFPNFNKIFIIFCFQKLEKFCHTCLCFTYIFKMFTFWNKFIFILNITMHLYKSWSSLFFHY